MSDHPNIDPKILARRETQRRYRERQKAKDPDGYAAKHREQQARYKSNNREAVNAAQRVRYHNRTQRQIEADRKRKREYDRERYKNDPNFRECIRQSKLVYRILNGQAKADQLGYTTDVLQHHLETNFKLGMTWDNYGSVWEIDHIRPISQFVNEGVTAPAVISALSNLRPLWCTENKSKGNRTITAGSAVAHLGRAA
jgi:hypothetical protein